MGNSIINTGLQKKDYAFLTATQDQTPTVGEHIEYDTIVGNLALSTGAGQANGLVTLLAGRKYILEGVVSGAGNGGTAQYLGYQWYDVTNSVLLGARGQALAITYTTGDPTPQQIAKAIVSPVTNIQVELRETGANDFGIIYGSGAANNSYAYIESIEAYVPTVSNNTNPSGAMVMFGGSVAPAGYLLCDGASVATATYPNLFAAIGYTFGGAGASFNVPDMRGASPAGAGTSTGYSVDETITLGAKTDDIFQAHTHGTPNVLVAYNSGNGAINYNTGLADAVIYQAGDVTIGTNGRTGTVTKGKSVGVNFIIKY